ncbi:type II restriction enzyme, methylase subunit, partial [mine drainage metagenome]
SRHRLPTLEKNVRVGNSLVEDSDLDTKAFAWPKEFPLVSEDGGFDVVVGNPPWVQSKFLPERFKEYYSSRYSNASKQYDLFTLFMERGVQLLKPGGILGFIVPDRFLANSDYRVFRQWLLETTRILRITPTGEGVFEGVEMPSAILILQKPRRGRPSPVDNVEIQDGVNGQVRRVSQGKLAS